MKWLLHLKDVFSGFLTHIKLVLISAALAGLGGFALGWHEKALRVPALLEAQKQADKEQCDLEKATTRRANEKLQADRDRITGDLTRYKRLHPTSCVIPARQSELRSGGAEYARGDGKVAGTTDDFRDYAATAERYRSDLLTCIQFLADERKAQ